MRLMMKQEKNTASSGDAFISNLRKYHPSALWNAKNKVIYNSNGTIFCMGVKCDLYCEGRMYITIAVVIFLDRDTMWTCR